uniref:Uncharacterized protein n=1 Tax=Burkholderia phage vB_BgluM-SURPRISE13 TaxID=3159457 RepID=A0AAU7PG07_9VIRU
MKKNFAHINQFKRNGHEPLPKAEPQPVTDVEWLPNGHFIEKDAAASWARAGVLVQPSNVGKSLSFGDMTKFFTNFYQVKMLEGLIRKYPRPPEGIPRFWLKGTIPRDVSDEMPFGDPTVPHFAHRVFNGTPVRRLQTFPTDVTQGEYRFIKDWINSIVVMA